jgi:uncharacterized protein
MSVTFWNTMAVTDLDRARRFYEALGFTIQPMPGGAGVVVCPNPNSMICLFTPQAFGDMIPGEVCDPTRAQEIIQSLSAPDREGVDALIAKAVEAGGRALGKAKKQPFGYAGGFADPDGHVWSVLWLAQGGG